MLLQADATDDDAGALDGGVATNAAAYAALIVGILLFVYVFACAWSEAKRAKNEEDARKANREEIVAAASDGDGRPVVAGVAGASAVELVRSGHHSSGAFPAVEGV